MTDGAPPNGQIQPTRVRVFISFARLYPRHREHVSSTCTARRSPTWSRLERMLDTSAPLRVQLEDRRGSAAGG